MQRVAFLFPETVRHAIAIDPRDELAPEVGDRLADLVGGDFALDQLDPAGDAGEIGHIFGDMFAMGRSGEQQAGKIDRVDDVGRACLAREQFVIRRAHDDANRQFLGEVADRQDDQDRGIVAAGRNDRRARCPDVHVLERFVACRVGGDHVAAHCLGDRETFFVAVDHYDVGRGRSAGDQFLDRFGS